MTQQPTRLRPDAGVSMIEILLAMTILIFAASATLLVYDDVSKSFKRGYNAIEQQQAVRIGFEKLALDVQMAGHNHNPDGDAARPDEQIEAAFDTAIVIRGDFDAQHAAESQSPEDALGGGAFDSVTVGNDEIVAFVLAKPDGSSSGTLTFSADVKDVPRDGAVELVSIPNVALVHDDPPYDLYRITLNNDAGTWGAGTFFVRTLLAENVRSLSFRYLDRTGTALNGTFDLTSTADDIGGAETAAARATRESIHRISVNLVGLTRDPDPTWVDTTDGNPATSSFRKFDLASDLTPRNLGKLGVEDLPPN